MSLLIGSILGAAVFPGLKYVTFSKGSYSCAKAAIDVISGALLGYGIPLFYKQKDVKVFVCEVTSLVICNQMSNFILALTDRQPLWIRVGKIMTLALICGLISSREEMEKNIKNLSAGTLLMLFFATIGLLADASYNRFIYPTY